MRKWLIMLALVLGTLLEVIDMSIVNVALPTMMGNLGATLDQIGWVVTGYVLSNVIVIPMSGWLAHRFGRRNYFGSSIVLFTIASVFAGMANSLEMLVIFRIFQGLAGGALLATSQTILMETFPPRQQGMAMAIFGIGVMVGPTLGPTLGGWITDNWNWRWIFYINVPVGFIAIVLSLLFIHDPEHFHRKKEPIDWIGIALLTAGLGSLQYVLGKGETKDWFQSPLILRLTLVAFGTLPLFLWREMRVQYPVVDVRILRNPSLSAGTLFSAVFGVVLFGSFFILPVYMQSLLGFTAWQIGWVIFPGAIATALAMPLVGWMMTRRVDTRILVATGTALVIYGHWLMTAFTLETGARDMFWPMVVRGLGMGLIFVPLSVAALGSLERHRIAAGAGLYNLSRQLGGSFGIALMATLVDRREAVHYQVLSASITAYNPIAMGVLEALADRLVALGQDLATAPLAALELYARLVHAQAAMLSFADTFRVLALLFAFSAPLLLLLRRPRRPAGRPALH